jgi:hypothetical protein
MAEHTRDDGSMEADLQRADDLAAAAIREGEAVPPRPEAPHPGAARRHMGPVVALVCLAIVASQLPAIMVAFDSPPSIRVGATPDDDGTEACVDTLWKISSLLQHRELEEIALLEPTTQQPYVVRRVERDTVVECPNPHAHDLSALRVSAAHRAPEAQP